jgi:hypothetical protein
VTALARPTRRLREPHPRHRAAPFRVPAREVLRSLPLDEVRLAVGPEPPEVAHPDRGVAIEPAGGIA